MWPCRAVRDPLRAAVGSRPGHRYRRCPSVLQWRKRGGAETIDFSKTDVYDELMKRTSKRGPNNCIDAVGCEASGHGAADAVLDKVKAAAFLATDRVHVVRQAIMCCRKAGTISIPGVYVGMGDKIPLGAVMNKGLTIKTGQTHVQGLYQAASEEDRSRRDRSQLRRYSPGEPGRCAGDVQKVPRQGRRRHQSRAATRSIAFSSRQVCFSSSQTAWAVSDRC
jgi:hypothetical protein